MLKDRRKWVETNSREKRRLDRVVEEYGSFLSDYFSVDDWLVTVTLRDRELRLEETPQRPALTVAGGVGYCGPDPRLQYWEPSSRYRPESGPPVRDAALRELNHWLFELGWEAAGRRRQEIFDWLTEGKLPYERKSLARNLSRKCLYCEIEKRPALQTQLNVLRATASGAIGWVIAEEFGRLGGRWHVHILIKGVSHLRRRKWWRRAFLRFGRSRIEPIHE